MSSAVEKPAEAPAKALGMRVNGTPALCVPHFQENEGCQVLTNPSGKNWHEPKKPFRPTAGLTSYQKRLEERKAREAMKEKEKEMKEEKEAERQVGEFLFTKLE